MKICLLLVSVLFLQVCYCQNNFNKPYFLVDSIDFKTIAKHDSVNILESLKQYHLAEVDTTKISFLNEIMQSTTAYPKVSLKYNKLLESKVKHLINETRNKDETVFYNNRIADIYSTRGFIYYYKNQIDSALYNFDKSLDYYHLADDKIGLGDINNLKSVIYIDLGGFPKALECLEKSQKNFLAVQDDLGVSRNYLTSSNLYSKLLDYKTALSEAKLAYEYSLKTDDELLQVLTEIQVALQYSNYNYNDTAIVILNRVISTIDSAKYARNLAHAYLKLGEAYLNSKEYSNAKEKTQNGLKISKKIKDDNLICMGYNLLGSVVNEMGNYSSAENFANKAYQLALESNKQPVIVDAANLLAEILENKNDYKKSLYYYKQASIYKDSLINDENKAKLVKYSVGAEFEKQKLIDEIKNEQKLTEEIQKRKRQRMALLFIGLLAVLLSWFLLILRNRLKLIRKQKSEIDSAYQKLEESKQYELAFSNLKAIQSQMNPHFLFNVLNSLQGLIALNDVRNSNLYLGMFSDLLRDILASSEQQFIEFVDEIRMLELYLELEKLRFESDFKYTITNLVDEHIMNDMLIPAMFIQPYIENSIKHGLFLKKGVKVLDITFKVSASNLLCIIEDNGIGRDNAKEVSKKREHMGFATKANNSRIDLLNEMLEDKIELEIIDKVNSEYQSDGTIIKITFPQNIKSIYSS